MSDEPRSVPDANEETRIEDLPLTDAAAEVKGGVSVKFGAQRPSAPVAPSPSGPIPIPYPNLPK